MRLTRCDILAEGPALSLIVAILLEDSWKNPPIRKIPQTDNHPDPHIPNFRQSHHFVVVPFTVAEFLQTMGLLQNKVFC